MEIINDVYQAVLLMNNVFTNAQSLVFIRTTQLHSSSQPWSKLAPKRCIPDSVIVNHISIKVALARIWQQSALVASWHQWEMSAVWLLQVTPPSPLDITTCILDPTNLFFCFISDLLPSQGQRYPNPKMNTKHKTVRNRLLLNYTL